jgi:RNA polymerase sigma-70 factor (ECF subfamily)
VVIASSERFERVYQAHHLKVLGYVCRRVEEPADAADIVADVFVAAWRRLEHLPEPELSWLLGVARNLLRNHRRGRSRSAALAGRLAEALALENPYGGMAADVVAAVNRLSERDRELMMLTAWEGLTPTEAGAVVGLKASAARVRLHRARARLRGIMNESLSSTVIPALALDTAALPRSFPAAQRE